VDQPRDLTKIISLVKCISKAITIGAAGHIYNCASLADVTGTPVRVEALPLPVYLNRIVWFFGHLFAIVLNRVLCIIIARLYDDSALSDTYARRRGRGSGTLRRHNSEVDLS